MKRNDDFRSNLPKTDTTGRRKEQTNVGNRNSNKSSFSDGNRRMMQQFTNRIDLKQD